MAGPIPEGFRTISPHKEDLTPDEIGKRAAEFFANMGENCGG